MTTLENTEKNPEIPGKNRKKIEEVPVNTGKTRKKQGNTEKNGKNPENTGKKQENTGKNPENYGKLPEKSRNTGKQLLVLQKH